MNNTAERKNLDIAKILSGKTIVLTGSNGLVGQAVRLWLSKHQNIQYDSPTYFAPIRSSKDS